MSQPVNPTRRKLATAISLAAAMAVTAGAAATLKPTKYLADTRPELKIEPSLPNEFGDWKLVQTPSSTVVNPQQNQLLNILYSEIINRTYVNSAGYRVMLSIAYGKNQNDSFQVHKPEICYPAQGFELLSNTQGTLALEAGVIPVRRLETRFGSSRLEPVMYWTTLGDRVVKSGLEKKFTEINYALDGLIADGLLFRISSINENAVKAQSMHEQFVRDLEGVLNQRMKARLMGQTRMP